MQNDQVGTLYVVATPIGNLQDITLRALEVLKKVDRVVAEDTRHARPLLNHYSIAKPIVAMHEFNERDKFPSLILALQQGESIALISDAGTPLISDPGFHLVKQAKASGINVVPIPGASALIAALSVAGLATDKFIFEGFLPAKESARKQQLMALENETRTILFYEAPHRLIDSLQTMIEVFGENRSAVVARELTKIYESVLGMSLKELLTYFKNHTSEVRGEIVILIAGNEKEINQDAAQTEKILTILLQELPLKQAVAVASKITGERKNILYSLALTKNQTK